MNFKTTIVLVVMLLLLGAAVWYVQWRNPNAGAPPAAHMPGGVGNYLFNEKDLPRKEEELARIPIAAVTIAAGGKSMVLTRDGTNWSQTQPIQYPMDGFRIDNLITTAGGLRYSSTMKPGGSGNPSLEDMKLAPPLVTLTLDVQGPHGGKQVLRLGRTVPGTRLAYLLKNDDPTVYLVEEALSGVVMPSGSDPESVVKDWRSKHLPAPAAGQVDHVQFTQGGTTAELARSGEQWMLVGPQAGRAGAEAVKNLIGAAAIGVDKFVDDQAQDLSQYGLDQPTVIVSLRVPGAVTITTAPSVAATQPVTPGAATPGAGVTKTLRLGMIADHYYATWSDAPAGEPSRLVFEVGKYYAEQLTKTTIDSLRDPRVLVAAAADVKEIAVKQGGKPAFTLVRTAPTPGAAAEGLWSFGDPKPGYEPDQAETNRLIASLADARALSYVPDAKPKAQSLAVVSITAAGGTQLETLTIYPPDQPDGPALVIHNSETVGYRVSPERFERLTGPVLALRDRKVLDLQGAQVAFVGVRQAGKEAREYKFGRPVILPPSALTQPATTQSGDLSNLSYGVLGLWEAANSATQPATTQPLPGAPKFGPWQLDNSEKFETAALEELIRELSPLRAERWLTPGAAPSTSEEIVIDIGATRGTMDISCHLHIDAKTRRAYVDPQSPFEVPPALVAAATAEFRDRTILPISGKDIQKITVVRDGKSITLEKGDNGQYAATDGRQVGQSAVGGLFDALAGLRVEHYVVAPPKMAPATEIRVVMRDAKTYELQLFTAQAGAENGPRHARLGDRWFTLSDDTAKKLEADPATKDDAPMPAPGPWR